MEIEVTGIEAIVCKEIARRQTKWTLLKQVSGGKHPKWLAKCDCGTEKEVYIENIRRGKSLSCGCHRTVVTAMRTTTHGRSGKTKEYKSWAHMKGRCLNPKDAAFKDYGGRGIKICERWLTFENFFADMGPCPVGYSIERIDVNGDYEPSNCKWLDRRHQARNTRATRFDVETIVEIRRRLKQGFAASALAQEYKTTSGHIRQIKNEIIWKGI